MVTPPQFTSIGIVGGMPIIGPPVTAGAVSYTHLTLPTNREVEISEVAVSIKKKHKRNRG